MTPPSETPGRNTGRNTGRGTGRKKGSGKGRDTGRDTGGDTGSRPKALIVGAGIGGLTLAVALRKVGVDAEIYERASELRAAGSGLSVMTNALTALDSLGIDLGLDKRGQAVTSFTMKTARGRLIKEEPLVKVADEIGVPCVCLSRTDLQHALLDALGDTPITLGATATGVETDDSGAVVHFADGTSARGDVVVGADGFNSVVRRQFTGPDEPAEDSGYISWLGIVPFTHRRLPPGAVAHYWGKGSGFGLIDIGHGRFYWWGTKNMPEQRSHNWPGGKDEVLRAYSGWAEEVREVIQATPEEDIIGVPSRDRAFLESWGEGPVTLLGDAAHPMLTCIGQGAAMAMEDAVVLARTLRGATDLSGALRTYEDLRRERTRMMVVASRKVSDRWHMESRIGRLRRNTALRLARHADLMAVQRAALVFPDPDAA
ncbi:2-polyprenyl-6-methoxyphenol hydroxylase-like FAD-dependent oxidoreductase [Streptomyces sp. Amel2xB2]|uniref:FAD-dependent monooxygenase n=1 Tax=Streptomyces sp. Amel2xB2 TaxID=1305829 RepID=UPI000DBA8AA2|nr:FAD-dependent monooxygenase [Streptomyces sp. Amel2xB2]RAJ58265.1 2-polyprenyl-6-methoxyphenol hydroxylase-like FAD-dependent oxidoreductase [Streptomyces sp. Amel2xB2]